MSRVEEIEQRSAPLMSNPGGKRGGDTMGLYGEWDGDQLVGWSPDRLEWHRDVFAAHEQLQMEENGRPPKAEKKALIMTGLPGSGKTFVLKHSAPVELADYVTVNADDLKESIIFDDTPPDVGDLHGMELASVVHEESSYMAKAWQADLEQRGMNIALDVTGANKLSTINRMRALINKGYEVSVIHVDVGPDEAWASTLNRFQAAMGTELGGRPVPAKFMQSMAVDSERDVIDGHFETYRTVVNGNWWHYKNHPITREEPELINSNAA